MKIFIVTVFLNFYTFNITTTKLYSSSFFNSFLS